jgi:hypothetical protein
VLHEAAHYAVLEIDIHNKKVHVYDGLYRDLDRWLDYVFSAMKHCKMCDCHMPPSYVLYKGTYVLYDGTFGMPDQGQMLDV